ncbi:MAG: hypothetical protein AAFQ51_17980, partial [Pseudomonadota bacterium]
MHSKVDAKHLPLEMAKPNVMVVPYTTNVLFPKLGPLAVKRYVRVAARLLTDYAAMLKAAELDKDTGKKPRPGRRGGQSRRRNPVFINPHEATDKYYAELLEEFRDFDRRYLYSQMVGRTPALSGATVVGARPGTTQPDVTSPGGGAGGGVFFERPGGGAIVERIGDVGGIFEGVTGTFTIGSESFVEAFPIGVVAEPGATATALVSIAADGRIVEPAPSMADVMLPGGSTVPMVALSDNGRSLSEKQVEQQLDAQDKSYKTALLYSWMALPNAVAADLYDLGAIADTETVFVANMLAGDTVKAVATLLDRATAKRQKDLSDLHSDYTDARIEQVQGYIDMALKLCERLDVDLGQIPARYAR